MFVIFLSSREGLAVVRNLLVLGTVLLSLGLTILNKDSIYVVVTSFLLINPLTCLALLIPVMLVFLVSTKIKRLQRKYLFLLTVPVIFIFYATYFGLVKVENTNPISTMLGFVKPTGWWRLSPQAKIDRLITFGPNVLVNIGLAGVLIAALSSKRKDASLMIFLLLLSLLILMFPEGETYRVFYGLGFLLSFFAALFIDELASLFKNIVVVCESALLKEPRKVFASTLIFLTLFGAFSISTIQQSQRIAWNREIGNVTPEGTHSFYMTSEIATAEWLYSNTPLQRVSYPFFDTATPENETLFFKVNLTSPVLDREKVARLSKANDTIIISDPFTMASLSAMTLRNALMPERVFIYEEEYSNYTISFLRRVKEAFQQPNASSFTEEIRRLKGEIFGNTTKETYIVISQRTLTWLSSDITFVRRVSQSNNWKILDQIMGDKKFKLVYTIPEEVYVFKCILD